MHTLSQQLSRHRIHIAIFLVVFVCGLLLSATAFAADNAILKEKEAELLPLARWIDGAGTFHDRVGFSVNNAGEWMGAKQRSGVVGTIMGVANFFWSTSLSLLTQALSLDMLKGIARTIDLTATSLGKAVMGQKGSIGLLVLIVIAFIVWSIWKSRTLGIKSIFKTVAPRIVAISLLSLMVFSPSAAASQKENLAPFSAAWYIETGNKASNAIAMPILEVSGLVTSGDAPDTAAFRSTNGGTDGLACYRYVDQLRSSYLSNVKDFGKRPDAQAALVLSNLWENSGMQVWKQIQLGNTSYADRAYCRLLDGVSATPAFAAYGSTAQTYKALGATDTKKLFSSNFPAIANGVNSDKRDIVPQIMQGFRGSVAQDKATVAWAACMPQGDGTWKGDPELFKGGDGKDSAGAAEECKKVFAAGQLSSDFANGFNWNKGINDNRSYNATLFVDTLQGRNTADGTVTSIAYLVASIAVGVAFSLMALAILIAKIAMVGFASFLALILIGSIFPGQDTTKKLGDAAKTFLGYSFISAFAVGILALVVLLTNIIVTLMSGFIDPGSTFSILLVGFAPVISIYILNTVFKKMGIPSPMSIKGAMSWGESAGGLGKAVIGGAVAGGVGGSLMNRAARQATRAAGDITKSALGNKIGNGPSRRGESQRGMAPLGDETKSATDKSPSQAARAPELSPEEAALLRKQFAAEQKDAQADDLASQRAQREMAKIHGDDLVRSKMEAFDLRSPGASTAHRWLADQSATIAGQWDRAKNYRRIRQGQPLVDVSHPAPDKTPMTEKMRDARASLSSAASKSAQAIRTGAKYATKHPVSAAGKTMARGAKYAAIAGGVGVAAGIMPITMPVLAGAAVAGGAHKLRQGKIDQWEDQDAKFEEWRQARYAKDQEAEKDISKEKVKEKAVPQPAQAPVEPVEAEAEQASSSDGSGL